MAAYDSTPSGWDFIIPFVKKGIVFAPLSQIYSSFSCDICAFAAKPERVLQCRLPHGASVVWLQSTPLSCSRLSMPP